MQYKALQNTAVLRLFCLCQIKQTKQWKQQEVTNIFASKIIYGMWNQENHWVKKKKKKMSASELMHRKSKVKTVSSLGDHYRSTENCIVKWINVILTKKVCNMICRLICQGIKCKCRRWGRQQKECWKKKSTARDFMLPVGEADSRTTSSWPFMLARLASSGFHVRHVSPRFHSWP